MESDVANRLGHRLQRMRQQGWKKPVRQLMDQRPMQRNVALDCGWGRLLFAQTFDSPAALVQALGAEGPQRRDIAFTPQDVRTEWQANAERNGLLDGPGNLSLGVKSDVVIAEDNPSVMQY